MSRVSNDIYDEKRLNELDQMILAELNKVRPAMKLNSMAEQDVHIYMLNRFVDTQQEDGLIVALLMIDAFDFTNKSIISHLSYPDSHHSYRTESIVIGPDVIRIVNGRDNNLSLRRSTTYARAAHLKDLGEDGIEYYRETRQTFKQLHFALQARTDDYVRDMARRVVAARSGGQYIADNSRYDELLDLHMPKF